MRKQTGLLFLIIAVATLTVTGPAFSATETPPMLTMAKQKLAMEFDRLDSGLKQAAQTLGSTGLAGEESRSTLVKLCSSFDYAVDCATVDLQGRMITIEPAPFRRFEGTGISSQEQVKRIMATGKPVMSNVFRSVEGVPAIDAEYPVVTPGGQRLGFVSVLFFPEKFLGRIIGPLVQGTPVQIWVMEKGGLILYDIDTPQIGMNLFTSPLYQPYTSLISLGRRVCAAAEGKGAYEFPEGTFRKVVTKHVFWQSTGLYGTEWRLVATRVAHKGVSDKTGIATRTASPEEQLERFAEDHILTRILDMGDKNKAIQFFKKFYDETPGIYSIQWIDEKGINRFGYPKENSLADYDYSAGREAHDKDILRIVTAQQPVSSYEDRLFEGGTGIFTFRPVFLKKKYLGMVYIIRLKK